ncbi:hypothetical protein Patl1_35949 [Pistacia atlantica]|nr:hypothetical protein Patl1_35949 [Pistacia atlantica]
MQRGRGTCEVVVGYCGLCLAPPLAHSHAFSTPIESQQSSSVCYFCNFGKQDSFDY